jgi:hypothetical protein
MRDAVVDHASHRHLLVRGRMFDAEGSRRKSEGSHAWWPMPRGIVAPIDGPMGPIRHA